MSTPINKVGGRDIVYSKVQPGPHGVFAVKTLIALITRELQSSKKSVTLQDIATALESGCEYDVIITPGSVYNYKNKKDNTLFDGAAWICLRANIEERAEDMAAYLCMTSKEFNAVKEVNSHKAERMYIQYMQKWRPVFEEVSRVKPDFLVNIPKKEEEEAVLEDAVEILDEVTEVLENGLEVLNEPAENNEQDYGRVQSILSPKGERMLGYTKKDGSIVILKGKNRVEHVFLNDIAPQLMDNNVSVKELLDYLKGLFDNG